MTSNRDIVTDAFHSWANGTGHVTSIFADEMTWEITGKSAVSKKYVNTQQFVDEVLSPFGARFAAGGAFAGLPFPSNPRLRVIGCVDSRVDPSDVRGLELGDAVVERNISGRVTPASLRSWAHTGQAGPRPRGRPGPHGPPAHNRPAPHRLRDHDPRGVPRTAGRVL
jgi:hypothetical protein